jgi:hypothetical protein
MAEKRRSVVHEHEFIEDLSRLIFDEGAGIEYIAGAEDLLSREPMSGVCVDADDWMWFLDLPPIRGHQVGLWYTFDDDTVIFLHVLTTD